MGQMPYLRRPHGLRGVRSGPARQAERLAAAGDHGGETASPEFGPAMWETRAIRCIKRNGHGSVWRNPPKKENHADAEPEVPRHDRGHRSPGAGAIR